MYDETVKTKQRNIWLLSVPDVINVSITVAEGGLLSLTQQIARIGGDFVQTPAASTGDLFTGQTSATPVQQQQLLPYSSNTSSPQVGQLCWRFSQSINTYS